MIIKNDAIFILTLAVPSFDFTLFFNSTDSYWGFIVCTRGTRYHRDNMKQKQAEDAYAPAPDTESVQREYREVRVGWAYS